VGKLQGNDEKLPRKGLFVSFPCHFLAIFSEFPST